MSELERSLSKESELAKANILLEVSRKCALKDSLDEVLTELVAIASRVLNCERGTLFLNDPTTGELYSRIAQGDLMREIRIMNDSGIAGHVFQTGEPLRIDAPYQDPRFNRSVDEYTGYKTRGIICAPVKTMAGETIGVMQSLNKIDTSFTDFDLDLLGAMAQQASISLRNKEDNERIKRIQTKEMSFLEVVSDINAEVDLSLLLQRVVAETTQMLNAERATIFLYDQPTNTLFSRVAAGPEITEIRFPSHVGIAGAVFTSAETMNIPHAYADLRFNPAFDRQTGFFTRSILCVPIINKDGNVIGVTQVLNKKGTAFNDEDEQRLKAFTAQIAIALENSKLFDDVQRMKNYNESILESMSNGVITLNPGGTIVTCNAAGARIWEAREQDLLGMAFNELLGEDSLWVADRIESVKDNQQNNHTSDTNLTLSGITKSVNLTIMPLVASDGEKELGSMLMVEDISSEKRMKSTMSRYMDPTIAAQMLDGDALELLGGVSVEATVMFTDVRGFTTITEEYGAQGTVKFLNEYFTMMVDSISHEGGMLDKFIGDAIMACFGLPMPHDDDPDRAARAAIGMIKNLWDWNQTRQAKGLKTVDMGVGLNTGTVVSGNIGSPKRMDYTVIGDGVNLAARLESACKAYSARILASESTVSQLRGTYKIRDVDLVIVKGKTEPVKIYEMLDYHSPESFPNLIDVVNYFTAGIDAYRNMDWQNAIARFEKCLELNPDDGLSKTYLGRCHIMKASPPAGDWDGVWVMTEK